MAPILTRLGQAFGFGAPTASEESSGSGPISASGGDITPESGTAPGNGFKYHAFGAPGNFVISSGSDDIEILVVGGGGGGDFCAGGGGGGGIVYAGPTEGPIAMTPGTYAVAVGEGAAGGQAPKPNGGDSTLATPLGTITGKGGGSPGVYDPSGGYPMPPTGGDGGCGAGGGASAPQYNPDSPYPGPWNSAKSTTQPQQPNYSSKVLNYGNIGGAGGPATGTNPDNNHLSGGGGGGAGGAGQAASGTKSPAGGGNGGPGASFSAFEYPLWAPGPVQSNLTPHSPTNTHFGGGAGGGLHRAGGGGTGQPSNGGGAGGIGGGGRGGNGPEANATAGTNYLGGGGGSSGGGEPNSTYRAGGDGIVIIRYSVS